MLLSVLELSASQKIGEIVSTHNPEKFDSIILETTPHFKPPKVGSGTLSGFPKPVLTREIHETLDDICLDVEIEISKMIESYLIQDLSFLLNHVSKQVLKRETDYFLERVHPKIKISRTGKLDSMRMGNISQTGIYKIKNDDVCFRLMEEIEIYIREIVQTVESEFRNLSLRFPTSRESVQVSKFSTRVFRNFDLFGKIVDFILQCKQHNREVKTLAKISLVSKEWRQFLTEKDFSLSLRFGGPVKTKPVLKIRGFIHSMRRLTELELCNCGLTDIHVQELNDLILSRTNLTKISLAYNDFLPHQIEQIFRGITHLIGINLSGCPLRNQEGGHAVGLILNSNTRLQNLSLEKTILSETGFQTLIRTVKPWAGNYLRTLDLKGNRAGSEGTRVFTSLYSRLTSLELLNFSGNYSSEGIRFLSQFSPYQLIKLDLSICSLEHESESVVKILKSLTQVTVLNIGCNCFDGHSLISILNVLQSRSMKALALGILTGISMFTGSTGRREIMTKIIQKANFAEREKFFRTTLQNDTIDNMLCHLASNGDIRGFFFKSLTDILESSHLLELFDLSGFFLDSWIWRSILTRLQKHEIKTLCLGSIRGHNTPETLKYISSYTSLTKLDMSSMCIRDSDILEISFSKKLMFLDLWGNGLKNSETVIHIFNHHPKLSYINLGSNCFSQDEIDRIRDNSPKNDIIVLLHEQISPN